MSIKVIETKYNGILFRSRLEARWAVFFDRLSIRWNYEFEGYVIDQTCYLPDFWLPEFNGTGMYVEVKPVELNKVEKLKADLLVLNSGNSLFKAIGQPGYQLYEIIYRDICNNIPGLDRYKALLTPDNYLRPANTTNKNSFDERYINAVESALSERFNK